MHNPPHPGESIREDILPALGTTVTELAGQLGVARVTLSRLINGQAGISADMARRLEAWLGGPKNGPSAESWLRMQADTIYGRGDAAAGAESRQSESSCVLIVMCADPVFEFLVRL